MSMRLEGKTCLVTGAGAGIGRASALAMARAGAQVLATDIDAAALASLQAEGDASVGGIHAVLLDVTRAPDITALLREYPAPNVLFNCAGFVHQGDILSCSDADWRLSFTLNVDSMFHLCKAVLPGMVARGSGSIINMASVASSVKGVVNRFAYGASKAAVIGLSKAVAADFAGRGIRCNAICPGTVKTPSLGQRG